MSQSRVTDLEALGAGIKALWVPDVQAIPPLDARVLPAPSMNSAVTTSAQPTAINPAAAALPLPDWVTQVQVGAQTAAPTPQVGAAWMRAPTGIAIGGVPAIESHSSASGWIGACCNRVLSHVVPDGPKDGGLRQSMTETGARSPLGG